MTWPEPPKFKVLDIVQTQDEPDMRGVITQVRRYPDGEFRYSVLPLTDDPNFAAAVYPETWLSATGGRAPIDMFALPGGLREGDVVVVANECGDDEYAGRSAVVTAGVTADGDVGFWIEELGESGTLPPRFLVPTGDRIQRQPFEPREVGYTSVSEDGAVTGQGNYLILDNLSNYLTEAGL